MRTSTTFCGRAPAAKASLSGGRKEQRGTGERDCRGVDLHPDELRDLRGRRISMIFQDPMTSLNPVISIGEQLTEVIFAHEKIRKDAAYARAVELLEMVGMPNPKRTLSRLSPTSCRAACASGS